MANQKLFLIDGMSIVFRAYHALFRAGMKNSEGQPTGAVFGFTNILTSLIERENPEYICVCFDRREPTFRHEKYELYKANRDEFPEELEPQLPQIKEIIDLIGIPRLEKSGYEADDIIGTLAKRSAKQGFEVMCVTSDKDYYQLVDEKIKIYKPGKGDEFEIIDDDGVVKKFGVVPKKVIEVMALMGDSSDNIPGVKGIGPKTAAPLINDFGSLDKLYESLENVKNKRIANKLKEAREEAFLSKWLVTIDTDVELDKNPEDLRFQKTDFDKLDNLFKKLNFTQIRKKWLSKKMTESEVEEKLKEVAQEKHNTIHDIEKNYKIIKSKKELSSCIKDLTKGDVISFDLETSSLDKQSCKIVGIALSSEEGKAYYIPTNSIGNQDGGGPNLFSQTESAVNWQDYLPIDYVLQEIEVMLTSEKIGKCGQNAKFDWYILKRHGIDVHPIVFDSMVASYVLNPDDKHNMDDLSRKWLNYSPVPISALIGEKKSTQKSMLNLKPELVSDYACEDADITLKLMNILSDKLSNDTQLDKLARDIEFPIIETLGRMEYAGVAIDTAALKDISKQINSRLIELTENIYDKAGTEFNIDSPKQLGHILFEKMNIPPVKKTKTGYSTDVSVLNQLSGKYPIASEILNYRQLAKLKSTYIDALPKLINNETGRIHTTYNQTIASTGRLSSTDPNLQNIPIRTDLGKEIRKAFIARPSKGNGVILAADYSQIELRIMAYICGDEAMVEGFKNGMDIHSATAGKLFEKSLEEVTSDDRRIAKTVNFGIMYGLGRYGLSQRLGIDNKKAADIIDNYFKKYPGIKKYIDQTIEFTREKGYAETLSGRRRYFPDINHKNRNRRTAAERAAINMPIQGTASDMMKIAMINIDKKMQKEGFKSKMIMQVHDELVFEALTDELDQLKELAMEEMADALSLGDVPVDIEAGVGENWLEAH